MSDTRIDEIAAGVYRISTPWRGVPGGFSFNQYLLIDDEPLLFHSGPRWAFPRTSEAIARVIPVERLRWIAFSHHENDEDGSVDPFLAVAPRATPLCGRINAMLNGELYARPPRALGDGEALAIGDKTVTWLDAPHLPHGWECGYLFEATTRTLLCGDLLTQPGADHVPLSESDSGVLEPSEALRKATDYYAHARDTTAMLERLAAQEPQRLACMHGSAFAGDGGRLLRELARRLS